MEGVVQDYLDNMRGSERSSGAGAADDHSRWNRNANSSCESGIGQAREYNSGGPSAFSQPPQQEPGQPRGWEKEESEEDRKLELLNDPRRRLEPVTRNGLGEDRVRISHGYDAPLTLLGEVAFQLQRRIMHYVFRSEVWSGTSTSSKTNDDDVNSCDKRYRFYGYTILNLHEKVRAHCRDPVTGTRDSEEKARLLRRFQYIITLLRDKFGFQMYKHGRLCQELMTKHGIFGAPPDGATIARLGLRDFRSVRNHVIKLSSAQDRSDLLILVDCLHYLGQREKKPVLCF